MSKELDAAIREIEKEYGKDTIREAGTTKVVEFIPTGIEGLDRALGVGGIPNGRIIEILGPESGGKSTLALLIIAQAQKKHKNKRAALIDMEYAYFDRWGDSLGVDNKSLYVAQPEYGEAAFDIAERLIKTDEFSIVVIDSVAAMIPQSELEGDYGDQTMGIHARMMAQGCRKINSVVSKHNTPLIFINQLRDKIGVMYGSKETSTGGRALRFWASIRIDIRRISGTVVKDEQGNIISHKVNAKIIKNKVAPPFRSAEFVINYSGTVKEDTTAVIEKAIDKGIIEKKGAWIVIKSTGEKLKGAQAFLDYFNGNEDFKNSIIGEEPK